MDERTSVRRIATLKEDTTMRDVFLGIVRRAAFGPLHAQIAGVLEQLTRRCEQPRLCPIVATANR
jgi:hypothetical protein